MQRMTRGTTLVLLAAAAGAVAAVRAAVPPPPTKVAGRSAQVARADVIQATKAQVRAKRPAPKFVSGTHAGMIALKAPERPDLINHIPRMDYDDWLEQGQMFTPSYRAGYGTYFRVVNNGSKAAGPSVLKLECQFIVVDPYSDPEFRAYHENLYCGQINNKSLPVSALQAGETSPESAAMKLYVLPGPCTARPGVVGHGFGYPYVKATVDASNVIAEGPDGEKNNWMWVKFCFDW